ncbi:trehalose-phosphatase [Marivita sp. GX14005]|uniref:trehalose-phosphatase n=1 Tax=Marivita sp. GX14005 TaxID=2942276 RepID=UPI0020197772|nr:trehalose-phosphatase [Marivita sp. GX14005]MCL3882687.1 trehalose-phosphatase [Marivita sp. GX14005]
MSGETINEMAEPLPRPDWSRHALFLDFDGTLTPIVTQPEDVRLSGEVRALLLSLFEHAGGAVAILSGRALADLEQHLSGVPVALSGSHGLECRAADGSTLGGEGASTEALDRAWETLRPFAAEHALLLERKPGALALHYRARPSMETDCRAIVERIAGGTGLRALHGNMVSEATLPMIDKGRALRGFMDRSPFKGRIPVMIGDDTTDEDAIAAAQALGGFGLRIGGSETCACYRVDTMQDALGWLSASLRAGTSADGDC